ncbi:hypothetical protein EROM_080710 [Encephalitozoon romaleae SJ-2008]|uniref:Uncharacterized protein n=1 Tax=Encephalitozoon romaleae (strain SJ-2008) TaxID=1178016 RepID=I7AFI9_ENCRO|nr:hypothetical protein EROM_080710 [Encephalitozoon romaleae SJ-2008]AFN83490.1 hypothetical protein EROM_080710 [Encephalitozoon romaleae SJ-2008]
MDEIFIGSPSKREIEMYLLNKEYSLLNNIKLRDDILSKRGMGGSSENEAELKFEFLKGGKPWENGLVQVVDGSSEKRKASIGYQIKNGRKTSGEKDFNGKIEKKRIGTKKIIERNTIKNSGYRYVTLVFVGSNEFPKPVTKRHRKKVRFCDSACPGAHNTGKPSSILLPASKTRKLPRTRKKEKVFVESLALDTENESEEHK